MTTYYVATLAKYVLVEAENERQARSARRPQSVGRQRRRTIAYLLPPGFWTNSESRLKHRAIDDRRAKGTPASRGRLRLAANGYLQSPLTMKPPQ